MKKNTDEAVINIIKKEMDKEITHQDIDTSHCLGSRKPDKNKPWSWLNFEEKNVRAKIFKKKRKLTEKWISVTESLTKTRMEELQKAREEHSFQNVWSNDSKILHKDNNAHNKVKAFYDYFFSNHGLGFDCFTIGKNFVSFFSLFHYGTKNLEIIHKNVTTLDKFCY